MLRGIGRLRSGGIALDPVAASWASGVIANGGTYSFATLSAVSRFVKSARDAGYWGKMFRINLMCGDNLNAALVPQLIGTGNATDTNVNFVSGDYTEATGLTGNGSTKYLRTGLVPNVLSANDTHIAYYNRGSASGGVIGVTDGASQFSVLAPYLGDQKIYSSQNDSGAGRVQTAGAIGTPFGFIIGSRESATLHTVYRNGISAATNATGGGTLPTLEMYVFADNLNGAAVEHVSTACAGYSVGSGLTAADVVAYSAHMEAFQDELGRGVA